MNLTASPNPEKLTSLSLPICGIGGVTWCAVVVIICHSFDNINYGVQEMKSLFA